MHSSYRCKEAKYYVSALELSGTIYSNKHEAIRGGVSLETHAEHPMVTLVGLTTVALRGIGSHQQPSLTHS